MTLCRGCSAHATLIRIAGAVCSSSMRLIKLGIYIYKILLTFPFNLEKKSE